MAIEVEEVEVDPNAGVREARCVPGRHSEEDPARTRTEAIPTPHHHLPPT